MLVVNPRAGRPFYFPERTLISVAMNLAVSIWPLHTTQSPSLISLRSIGLPSLFVHFVELSKWIVLDMVPPRLRTGKMELSLSIRSTVPDQRTAFAIVFSADCPADGPRPANPRVANRANERMNAIFYIISSSNRREQRELGLCGPILQALSPSPSRKSRV
jgi:hypothetical protein